MRLSETSSSVDQRWTVSHCLSLTHNRLSPTHTRSHTLALSRSLAVSLTLTHSLSLAHSLAFSLTLYHSLSLTHLLSLAVSHEFTHSLSLAVSHSLSLAVYHSRCPTQATNASTKRKPSRWKPSRWTMAVSHAPSTIWLHIQCNPHCAPIILILPQSFSHCLYHSHVPSTH